MFLRFTKKISRPVYGFTIALLMLFAPVLIVTTVESAPQKTKAKPTPTPKKKAAPDKKTQAKTKPTPKPTPAKSKTNSKNTKETASKNKPASKKNEKTTSAKTNQKTADKNKNSKTKDKKNSKQTLAANNKIPSKNAKNEKLAKTSDKNKNTSSKNTKTTADKNKSKQTTSKNTKPTVAKTTTKQTPKIVDTKLKTGNTTKIDDKSVEKTTETTNAELPEIIVTTFSVPLRSQAKPDAEAVSNVKLGTVLKVTEKNPAWYKVRYSEGGKTSAGWISANAVNDLNASGKTEIYRQIVERNYKPQMDFASASEFYEFTSKVEGELDNSDKSAEIELKRLLALRVALKTIPADKRETAPYKDFLKAQEKEIVYNEPAGQWLVVSNEFWDLHNKYKKMTVSDTIAWEAANNPLPGECEGYVNCYLFDMRMRFGEYLNLHPNGSHAAEAMKNMTDYLSPIVADSQAKKVYNGPTDVTDRAEFNNLIAELRTIVARLPFVEKEKTLQQLRTIAEAYR